jgi:hypothetical protein
MSQREKRKLGGAMEKGRSRSLEWLLAHQDYQGDECLIWPFARDPQGYGRYNFQGEDFGAHRKMCFLAHGAPPSPTDHAAHSCGKGFSGCVHPDHLRWKPARENIGEKEKHGTVLRGTKAPASKLSPEQVKLAKETKLEKRGDLQRLARQLSVHHSTLIAIRAGKTYK